MQLKTSSKVNSMEQRITIITLGVSNVENLTLFYETKFGWKKEASSNANISFFKLNGILLSLYQNDELAKDVTVNPDRARFKGFTLAHNVHSEKEVDELIENLRANEVTIVKEPQKTDWGGYSSYVSDIDGNLWEIAYNPYLVLEKNGTIKE